MNVGLGAKGSTIVFGEQPMLCPTSDPGNHRCHSGRRMIAPTPLVAICSCGFSAPSHDPRSLSWTPESSGPLRPRCKDAWPKEGKFIYKRREKVLLEFSILSTSSILLQTAPGPASDPATQSIVLSTLLSFTRSTCVSQKT